MRHTITAVALLALLLGVGQQLCPAQTGRTRPGKPAQKAQTKKKPYYSHIPGPLIPYKRMTLPYMEGYYDEAQKWFGPGYDDPAPDLKKLDSIRIGWLGPVEEPDPLADYGKQMLYGSQLAIEDANRAGGYRGKPFELMIHQDRARWGDSSNAMVKMVTREKVWGVLGTIESANSHVMMRAALKFPVSIINSATTDWSLMEHRVPFITCVIPNDRVYSYATAWHVFEEKKHRRVALFRLNNRDGRFSVKKLVDAARRLGHPFVLDQRFTHGEKDWTAQIRRIRGVKPDAVIVWGDSPEVGRIIRQMRSTGMKQPVYGWLRSVSPKLLSIAGKDAEGFACAFPYNPAAKDPVLRDFQRRYAKKYRVEPDVFGAYAYDGVSLLLGAIRKAGLNRVRVADKLLTTPSYRGVTGTIYLDGARNNASPIFIAEVKNGRWQYRPATIPREGYRPRVSSTAVEPGRAAKR